METTNKTVITIEATVHVPLEKAWELWNGPEHITKWCAASEDWHAPYAENDIRTGGKFKTTMGAKDGSMSFDFEGVYTNVKENEVIEYKLADDRKVKITFKAEGNDTKVVESFDPESENPIELQRAGWQSILNNFKKYAESVK